jgi:hypothetical protein
LEAMKSLYDFDNLKDGWNTVTVNGAEEEIYYISNPALGLWAVEKRFEGSGDKAAGNVESMPTDAVDAGKDQKGSGGGGVGGWAKPPLEA